VGGQRWRDFDRKPGTGKSSAIDGISLLRCDNYLALVDVVIEKPNRWSRHSLSAPPMAALRGLVDV
jgi:hypothetical protein